MHDKSLSDSIDIVSKPWKNSPYYDTAESMLPIFWDKASDFKHFFDMLDLYTTIELAAGHGRHSEIVASLAHELIVMDVLDENIQFCKDRLIRHQNVTVKKCSGADFTEVTDEWATAIFCYDAMVHFSPNIVESYITDCARVLKPGGRVLLHHSNYSVDFDHHYGRNPHARNHMTQEMIHSFSKKAGLSVIQMKTIDWAKEKNLDCISLLEKTG